MLAILIGYMFLFIHRPFEVWPSLAEYHLERVYMLGALLVLLIYSGKKWVPNCQHLAYFGFGTAVLACWLASPWMDKGQEAVENYFKILVFYVLVVLTVHDERSLRRLLLGFLAVMTVYMMHSLREYQCGRYAFRMGIPRMIGVDKTMGDPNSFGATLVFVLPFVVPFWMTRPPLALRLFLAGYVALSFVCIGLTGSRSAFVGLLLWVMLMIFRSRWRGRLALLGVMAAPLLWAALPPELQNRFETIIHPEVGPKSAIESGEDRLLGLRTGLELWGKYPATGCGPGVWRPATGLLIESHNLYGQTVGEMGTLGAIAFAGILLSFWANLRWVRKAYAQHPEWGRDFISYCTSAVGWAVFLLLFEGNFSHNLFRYAWLWYGGFLVIARHCLRERLQAAPQGDWAQMAAYMPGYQTFLPVPVYGEGQAVHREYRPV
jgi:hypothetical protein